MIRMHSIWVAQRIPLRDVYRKATAMPFRHILAVIRPYALVSRPFIKSKDFRVKSTVLPEARSPQQGRCYVTTSENKVEHTPVVVQKPNQKAQVSVDELVPKIVPALFIDALKNGTTSWDIVISRSLMIVLYNVLHPRRQKIPEVFPASLANLRFRDVALSLVQVDGHHRLFATVNYHYRWKSTSVKIMERTGPEQNAIDPLKLLLIYALRVGIVKSTSVYECYSEAKSRHDKSIVWEHPDWPVLPAWNRTSTAILADTSFKNQRRLGTSFALAMRSAGLVNLWPDAFLNHRVSRTRHPDLPYSPDANSTYSNSPDLMLEGEAFVQRFASINVVRAQGDNHTMVRGGSREMPTPFMFCCTNAQFGCEYTSRTLHRTVEHSRLCKITDEEAKAMPYCCSVCNTRFHTKESLYTHRWRKHNKVWVPRRCDNCDSPRIFATDGAYYNHMVNYHDSWKPTQCPVNNCDRRTYYKRPKSLFMHLKRCHWRLPVGESAEILKRLRAKQRMIPEDGCLSREESGLDIDTYTQPSYRRKEDREAI
ncbi:hypothetical protein BDV97DRAFT_345944 [Delphinella strobiligena]|nr:hypothetical protein BDV97DRAFT_345944 [Delphinella strobiligena]